ncbi:solute carrier organic anion transporter family member 4A1-like [Lineus longissimus]|uniref:solute carrier organic anion transporter family member 4A1-like n=1 Tax=Lineus longissimus TaxID=88925 RepID=UPI002B4F5D8B
MENETSNSAAFENYAIAENGDVGSYGTNHDDGATDVDTQCGYGDCKPACLQKCHNTKTALVVLSIFAIIQGFVVNGINNSNTTSMERRFGFSSLEVSFISASYDISAGLFVIPIGYYGRLGHKPRWLATACLIMGVGSCVMFLPHFITGPYEFSQDAGNLCSGNSTLCSTRTDIPGGMYLHLAILVTGQFLHGIGGTTLYTLGIIWLDDNVKLHQLPLYVGIMEGCSALGPAIGFVLGGLFLDFYVDFDIIDTNKLTLANTDPRWVGAWWIGFMLSGILAILCSLVVYCFGWEMPEAAENRKGRISQVHNDGSEKLAMKPGFGMTLKDLPKCTWLLLKNPTFMLLNLAGITAMLLVMAYATFMPKFVQNQFQQTASWSALLTGFVAIPGIAGGQLMGGIIPAKMKLKVRGMIILSVVSFAICLLPMPVFFARCSPTSSAGINAFYGNSTIPLPEGNVNLTAPCNSGCDCSTKTREPICGADGVEYFSGCYAGCGGISYTGTGDAQTKNFTNCACIAQNVARKVASTRAEQGRCPTNCDYLIPFLLLMFIISFAMILPLTPLVTVTLRVVPENLRGYALAVQWVFMRFFGSFPGPIIFGLVLDSSCIVWQDRCGERGSCWYYDSFRMGWTVFAFSIATGIASLIFMALAVYAYKPPPGEQDGVMIESSSQSKKTGMEIGDDAQTFDNDMKDTDFVNNSEKGDDSSVKGEDNMVFSSTSL